MATTAAPAPAQTEDKQWFALASDAVAGELGVDTQAGLSPAEAATRLEKYGPNAFVAAETEPRWRAFVRQYRDPMQIVLLVAGIGSIWPLHELGTGLVLLFLTLFNAVLGLNQEGKAAAAVAALQKMMIVKAKVRRGGELDRGAGRAARSGRRRRDRGGRRRARRRAAAEGGDARGRRVGADRREHAGGEGRRDGHADRRAARRPDRHGLHEHERDEGRRRARSSPRPGCRPRSATSRTCCPRRTSRPRR